jgi:predicted transcriptional regulator
LGNYRDRLDIIADILQVASKNPKKTQIMYQANLSYKILQKYLSEVLEASLINFQPENQYYTLTEKGQQFLNTYNEYSKNNKTVEKQLVNVNSKRRVLNDLCPSE